MTALWIAPAMLHALMQLGLAAYYLAFNERSAAGDETEESDVTATGILAATGYACGWRADCQSGRVAGLGDVRGHRRCDPGRGRAATRAGGASCGHRRSAGDRQAVDLAERGRLAA